MLYRKYMIYAVIEQKMPKYLFEVNYTTLFTELQYEAYNFINFYKYMTKKNPVK